MLEIKDLTIKTVKDRELISHLTFTLQQGDKLAIIGEEGNGKSTLLQYISNPSRIMDYAIVTGEVRKNGNKIGYLEQFLPDDWKECTVEDYLVKDNPKEEPIYERYNRFDELPKIFATLGIEKAYLQEDRKMGEISGGETVKIQLAKLLFLESDLLLLDEPTNDLDIETLEWLEEFIRTSKKPILYISHDETLLENTANCILHLEQLENKTKAKWTYEHMGYLDYREKRARQINRQNQIAENEQRQYQKQEEKWNRIYQSVAYKQETITRQNPSKGRLLAKKMKTVKAIEKRLEKQELTQKIHPEEAIFGKFHKQEGIHASKVILDLDFHNADSKIKKEHIVLKVVGKEKWCILGKNGVGKTTLLKKIYNILQERKDIKIGYMPQNYDEILPLKKAAIQFLNPEGIKEKETLARTYLASMKLTKEEMDSMMQNLSGGQKAKVFLVQMMLEPYHVLLLDEPTRNLSPLSNPVVRELLRNFNGAIISVSHDRKYIKEVCDHIYEMK